jgi:hypothetical protein
VPREKGGARALLFIGRPPGCAHAHLQHGVAAVVRHAVLTESATGAGAVHAEEGCLQGKGRGGAGGTSAAAGGGPVNAQCLAPALARPPALRRAGMMPGKHVAPPSRAAAPANSGDCCFGANHLRVLAYRAVLGTGGKKLGAHQFVHPVLQWQARRRDHGPRLAAQVSRPAGRTGVPVSRCATLEHGKATAIRLDWPRSPLHRGRRLIERRANCSAQPAGGDK